MIDQDGTKWIDEYYDEGYMLLKDRPSNLQKHQDLRETCQDFALERLSSLKCFRYLEMCQTNE